MDMFLVLFDLKNIFLKIMWILRSPMRWGCNIWDKEDTCKSKGESIAHEVLYRSVMQQGRSFNGTTH